MSDRPARTAGAPKRVRIFGRILQFLLAAGVLHISSISYRGWRWWGVHLSEPTRHAPANGQRDDSRSTARTGDQDHAKAHIGPRLGARVGVSSTMTPAGVRR